MILLLVNFAKSFVAAEPYIATPFLNTSCNDFITGDGKFLVAVLTVFADGFTKIQFNSVRVSCAETTGATNVSPPICNPLQLTLTLMKIVIFFIYYYSHFCISFIIAAKYSSKLEANSSGLLLQPSSVINTLLLKR